MVISLYVISLIIVLVITSSVPIIFSF